MAYLCTQCGLFWDTGEWSCPRCGYDLEIRDYAYEDDGSLDEDTCDHQGVEIEVADDGSQIYVCIDCGEIVRGFAAE